MNYTKYNPVSGEIISVLSITDQNSVAANLVDSTYIEGYYDPEIYYINVDTKTPIEKSTKPNNNYVWNADSKTWIVNLDDLIIEARTQRDYFLSLIDRVNPIWYSTLSTEQQQELQQYRQQLLDVPQQSGFPTSIEWPIKPSWI